MSSAIGAVGVRAPRAPGRRARGRPAGRRRARRRGRPPRTGATSPRARRSTPGAGRGPGRWPGARIARLGSQDVAQPAISAASSGATGLPPLSSSQAWYSRRSLSRSRAWPSSATRPVSRWSSRAWNRRLATATRRRTASPPRGRLEADLVDREAEIVEPPDPGPDRVPVVGRELRLEVELVPQRACSASRTDSAASTASSKASVAALHRAEVGQPEADVLDEDVEVVGALPVRQRGMDLARLGVDEIGLDLVAVAAEQRVRERAVAPEHARPVEVDEQRRHRVEQPVAIRARAPAGSASAGAGTGSSRPGIRSSRMAASPVGRIGQADRGDRRQPRRLEPAEHVELRRGDLAAAPPSGRRSCPSSDEEPDEVARRADRQVAEVERLRRPLGERASPTAGRAAGRRPRAAEASAARPGRTRPERARPSELLAQVGRHRRVVADRLVQVAGLGTMVAGGHLDERGAERRRRRARPRPSGSGRRRARARRHRRRARGPG